MGNVSQLVPGIHPLMAVASPDVLVHSAQFAAAAITEEAVTGLMDAAKVMAMTVVDLLGDEEKAARVRDEYMHAKSTGGHKG
jgi:hypothetical protein